MSTESVINEIAAERRRQIESEGYRSDHDDEEHVSGELALAAAVYALGPDFKSFAIDNWPWQEPPKFKDERRNLIRAAALLVAEIERLDRAEGRQPVPKRCRYCGGIGTVQDCDQNANRYQCPQCKGRGTTTEGQGT